MDVRLVVGWSGSAPAQRALTWALDQRVEDLLVVHVVDGLDLLDGSGDLLRQGTAESLRAVVADAHRTHPGTLIETRVVTGAPVAELARFAGPDSLLVVGDRHRAVLRFRAGWSLGAQLASVAPGPVAIIAQDDVAPGSGVVAGVDDSHSSRAALGFAASWAVQSSQTLHVVHAWEVPFLWSDRALMLPDDVVAELRIRHGNLVDGAVAEVRRLHPGLVVEGALIDGTASRVLSEASAGRSMLVVGEGDVAGFERLLLGSVAHGILVNLTVPTVVVGQHATAPAAVPQHADSFLASAAVSAAASVAPTDTIVAWDGSTPSRSALEWAVLRERSRGRRVEVITVADETAAAPGSVAAESEIVTTERAVATLLADVRRSAPDVVVRGRVLRGDVLSTLTGLTRPDTLLVIGTGDRAEPRLRFALSVGAHLLTLAHGPVAIIPRTVDSALTGVAVGVNGSSPSNAAVMVGAAEAARRGETLHLVHAWMEPVFYRGAKALDEEFVTELTIQHQDVLDAAHLIAKAAYPTLRIKTHLIWDRPARALADVAPRAALIVVGTSDRSGWRRALLGSVSHELVLNLEVPLIVVGHVAPTPSLGILESYESATGMQEEAFV